MTDDLTRRAIIAAHDGCGCDKLTSGERSIVELWRAERDDILKGAAANALTITARAEKAEAERDAARQVLAEHSDTGQQRCSTCADRGWFFANGEEYDCGRCPAGEAYAAPPDEHSDTEQVRILAQLDQVRAEAIRLMQRHDHCISGYRIRDEQDTDSDCAHCISADLLEILDAVPADQAGGTT